MSFGGGPGPCSKQTIRSKQTTRSSRPTVFVKRPNHEHVCAPCPQVRGDCDQDSPVVGDGVGSESIASCPCPEARRNAVAEHNAKRTAEEQLKLAFMMLPVAGALARPWPIQATKEGKI